MQADIIENLHEHFYPDQAASDRSKTVELINEVMAYCNYLLRLEGLTDKEKEDFVSTMEGGGMTEEMRKVLNDCKTDKKRDYYIDMWGRSTYFRQCAWLSYLHGETNHKP